MVANPFPQSDPEPFPSDDTALVDSGGLAKLDQNQIDSEPNVPVDLVSDGQDISSSDADVYQMVSDLGIHVDPVQDGQGISTIDSSFSVVSNNLSENSCEIDPQTNNVFEREVGAACEPRRFVSPDGSTEDEGNDLIKKPDNPDESTGNEGNNPKKKPGAARNNQKQPDATSPPTKPKKPRRYCPQSSNSNFNMHLCCGGPPGPKAGKFKNRNVYAWVRRCMLGSLMLGHFLKTTIDSFICLSIIVTMS